MHDIVEIPQTAPVVQTYASRKEIATMLAVNPATIARLEQQGCFPSYRVARSIRYKIEEIETYIKAQTVYFHPRKS